MALVAGVDSSTQSCKVLICDSATGAIVRSGSARHPDGTEVDPAFWWEALSEAIHAAGGIDDVEAISVAAQQHGLVALDATGQVIRPSLLWNDTRSAEAALDLIAEYGAENFVNNTGSLPVASFTITKLRWLKDHEPHHAARVAAVCLPHDWLTWRLRGYGPASESIHGPQLDQLTTDRSDASGTGYFNPVTNDYISELIELALGHVPLLPRVLGPNEITGTTPDGVVVAAGAGDNAGAALGLNAREGDAVISIGTSGTAFAVTKLPAHDAGGSVAGFADASGNYLPLVATLNAARVVDATARVLGLDFESFAESALSANEGSDGLVLVPYFEGERTPNLPQANASLHGMTLANYTPANVARAALEGMLSGLADGLEAVTSTSGAVSRILLVGGGAQSPATQQIASTVFTVPVEVPTPGEYVAMGAAVQAQWALSGERPNWEINIPARFPSAHNPVISQQYRRYQAEVARNS